MDAGLNARILQFGVFDKTEASRLNPLERTKLDDQSQPQMRQGNLLPEATDS
jgi:hypothetical protein